MFEKFPQEESSNARNPEIEALSTNSEMVRERLFSDTDLTDTQRGALREILINNGIKINMYKQMNSSTQETKEDAKVIEMNPTSQEEGRGEGLKKAM